MEEKEVILTREEIKRRFDIYNAKYFGGKLGKCRFFIFPKNTLAFGKYTDNTLKDGSIRSSIHIGQSTVWTEKKLELIIVHEMIHMYVRTIEGVRFDGLLGHGRHFRRQQKRLKKEFGLKIEVHPNFEPKPPKQYPKTWERVLLWLIDR